MGGVGVGVVGLDAGINPFFFFFSLFAILVPDDDRFLNDVFIMYKWFASGCCGFNFRPSCLT